MKTLYPIIGFALFLSFLSDQTSIVRRDRLGGKVYVNKEWILYTIMAMGMAVFVGLRMRGNDTLAYRQAYENMTGSLSQVEWYKLSAAPGLQLCEVLLHRIGASTQDYIMITSVFTIIVYLWFIRKYSTDLWLSVYYFITMGIYTFSMAAIKQTVAVAILVIATDRAIQKKWIRFILLVVIAELFHPYAFVYLIIPYLFFKPWTSRTGLLLIGTIFVSYFLATFMSGILSMTEALGQSYDVNELVGEGVNIFRVMVVWVPVILSYLSRRFLKKSEDRIANLMINASMINALIMFIGLFGTANYFARLANYFLIFQTLSLPYLFKHFTNDSQVLLKYGSIVCFAVYFYYQVAIANGSFDSQYIFMPLITYIKQLIL